MNIYQMRHAILAKHVGERITPAQLKAELLGGFPTPSLRVSMRPIVFTPTASGRVPHVPNVESSAGLP
jgi:hypothetical protein